MTGWTEIDFENFSLQYTEASGSETKKLIDLYKIDSAKMLILTTRLNYLKMDEITQIVEDGHQLLDIDLFNTLHTSLMLPLFTALMASLK